MLVTKYVVDLAVDTGRKFDAIRATLKHVDVLAIERIENRQCAVESQEQGIVTMKGFRICQHRLVQCSVML